MTDQKIAVDAKRTDKAAKQSRAKSLEEKLQALEAQAKLVREKLREEQRKEREENFRGVLALLKSEDLEGFSVEVWKSALPQIKAALQKSDAQQS